MMPSRFDRAVNTALAAAMLLCAGILVKREFAPGSPPLVRRGPPTYVSNWRETGRYALKFGNLSGPVQLVAFTDFECPFCRNFHEAVLPALQREFPESVGVSIVHFPLPFHRFARGAAQAAECGSTSSAANVELVNLLYSKQDSFGLKPWSEYARESGVHDSISFAQCINSAEFSRVDSGFALATRYGVQGTPGIMVNGWLFSSPPQDTTLVAAIRELLANDNQLSERRLKPKQ
jgi:protein-disulfide isomerase